MSGYLVALIVLVYVVALLVVLFGWPTLFDDNDDEGGS